MKALIVSALLLALLGCGIAAPTHNPGYASFDYPQNLGLQRAMEISLGPVILGIAARHVDDDPEVKALLKALDGVQIGVYHVVDGKDMDALRERVASAAVALGEDSWQAVVRVAEDDTNVHLLIKQRENRILGLTALIIDPEELVFVNMMGEIDEEMLASLPDSIPEGELFSLESLSLR